MSQVPKNISKSKRNVDKAAKSEEKIGNGNKKLKAINDPDLALRISNLFANNTLTKATVGLGNVDNTSDQAKPVSDATQAAVDLKQSLSAKGQANGYAGLDMSAKLPSAQLPVIALDSLSDVSISSAQNGQYLTFNSGNWINTTGSGGGGIFQLNGQNQAYTNYTTGIGTSAPAATLDVENSSATSASSGGVTYGVVSCPVNSYGYARILNLIQSSCSVATCTIIVNGTTYVIPASVLSNLLAPLYYIYADGASLTYGSNPVPPCYDTAPYFLPGAYLSFESGLYDPFWNAWTNQVSQQLTMSAAQARFGTSSLLMNASDSLVLNTTTRYCCESRAKFFLGAMAIWQLDFWIYPTSAGTVSTNIFSHRTAYSSGFGIAFGNSTGTLNLVAYISSTNSSWDVANGTAIGSLTLNQWCQIAIRYDGSKFVTYVNGTTTNFTASNNLPNPTTATTMFTSFGPYAGSNLSAYLDEIIITPFARPFAPASAFDYTTNAIAGTPFAAYLTGANTSPTDGYNLKWYASGPPGSALVQGPNYPGANPSISCDKTHGLWAPLGPNLQSCAEWTVEFQCNIGTISAVTNIVDLRTTQFDCSLVIQALAGGTTISTYLSSNGTSWDILNNSQFTVTGGTWFHMAITFSATRGGYSVYKNGVRQTNVASSNLLAPTSCIKIGCNPFVASPNFYINDFRISPSLVYTGTSFTPPSGLVGINAFRDLINPVSGACTTQGLGASTSNARVYLGSVRTDLQRVRHWSERRDQHVPVGKFGNGALSIWQNNGGFSSAQTSFSLPADKRSNGRNFLALIRNDGALVVGGDYNVSDGATGVPTPQGTYDQFVPVLSQQTQIAQVVLGAQKYLCVDTNNVVWGCGLNFFGSLGIGGTTTQTRLVPIYYASSAPILCLSAPYNSGLESLFIIDNGNMYAAGSNSVGQLGLGTTTQQNTLTLVPKISSQNWANVWQFGQATFAVTDAAANYTLYACGNNAQYSLGVGSSTGAFSTFTPCVYATGAPVTNVKKVTASVQQSTAYITVLILLYDGTVYVAGRVSASAYWTPGLGSFSTSTQYGFNGPICSGVQDILSTSGDDDPTLIAVRNDDSVWWLNSTTAGMLTTNGAAYSTSFQPAFFNMGEFIPAAKVITQPYSGYAAVCIISRDGRAYLSGAANAINNSLAGLPLNSTIFVPNEITLIGEPIIDALFTSTTDGSAQFCNTFLSTVVGKIYACGSRYSALAGQAVAKTTFTPLFLPFQ